MRQAFLISPSHSHLAQARTVLITTIPEEMCDEKELRLWASFVPGGIQNIWIYRDTTVRSLLHIQCLIVQNLYDQELNNLHKARLKACKNLEAASAKLIRRVVIAKGKQDKLDAKAKKKGGKGLRRRAKTGIEEPMGDVELREKNVNNDNDSGNRSPFMIYLNNQISYANRATTFILQRDDQAPAPSSCDPRTRGGELCCTIFECTYRPEYP